MPGDRRYRPALAGVGTPRRRRARLRHPGCDAYPAQPDGLGGILQVRRQREPWHRAIRIACGPVHARPRARRRAYRRARVARRPARRRSECSEGVRGARACGPRALVGAWGRASPPRARRRPALRSNRARSIAISRSSGVSAWASRSRRIAPILRLRPLKFRRAFASELRASALRPSSAWMRASRRQAASLRGRSVTASARSPAACASKPRSTSESQAAS